MSKPKHNAVTAAVAAAVKPTITDRLAFTQAKLGVVKDLPQQAKVDPLAEAIRNEIRSRLEGPITPTVLLMIGQLCDSGREMLAVRQDPSCRSRKCNKIGVYSGIVGTNPGYVSPYEDSDSSYNTVSISPTNKAETYAAAILREAIPALTSLVNPKPAQPSSMELIFAIAKARELKLHDIANKLEEQLRGEPAKPLAALPAASIINQPKTGSKKAKKSS